jgi:hypothetical protein
MAELNKARVNFKHYGLVPNEADAARLLGYAEQFFEVASPLFFSCDFASVSLADLITSPLVRERVKAAEVADRNGDIAEALGASAEAVELSQGALLHLLQPRASGFLPSELRSLLGWKGELDFQRYMQDQMASANKTSLALALSLNVHDLTRFKMIVPSVQQLVGGKFVRHLWRDTVSLTADDATFAVTFATRFALAVDARMPTANQGQALAQDGEDPLASL